MSKLSKKTYISSIVSMTMLLSLAMVLFSCQSEEQDEVDKQQVAIERYLSSPQYEGYVRQGGVYVFATRSTDPQYDTDKIAIKGDSILFWYEGYTFINASKGTVPFHTNKVAVMNAIEGLDTSHWPKEMIKVRIGGGGQRLIKGLARGLVNCREGDKLEIFITSDLAFGDNTQGGSIPRHTPIMYIVNVEKVIKTTN